MKKLFVVIMMFLLVTGCADMMNTPTKRVEEFLGKYQTMDKEVLDQLDKVLEDEELMTTKQKEKYRDIMRKQYQNLSYKIKDETVNGDAATVEVEVEVFDYQSAIDDANRYLEEHEDEFLKSKSNVVDRDDNLPAEDDPIDHEKFVDYKIEQMDKVKDKVKYTMTFTLTQKDKKWVLDDISEVDRLKIHGLYQ